MGDWYVEDFAFGDFACEDAFAVVFLFEVDPAAVVAMGMFEAREASG